MNVFAGHKTDLSRLQDIDSGSGGAVSVALSSGHINVSYLPGVGQFGPHIAAICHQNAEEDREALARLFDIELPDFNIIVAPLSHFLDGSGGAFHRTCKSGEIYCDAVVTPRLQPLVTCALAVAEMVEVCEAVQGAGWDCGATNGEGLSRVLATALRYPTYKGILDNQFAVAHHWLDSFRPDYVNGTIHNDTEPLSNGCAVLFLNYLHDKLGYSWASICQSPAPNLAGTYQRLTGDHNDPFPQFKSLLDSMYPPGLPCNLTTDNPWER
jgi:hypothetical protein